VPHDRQVADPFYGLGSMLGAGVYVLIGKAAGILGNAVWLAFVAAMVAALTTGLSYASVGSRYPKAGGAAYVTKRAYGLGLLSYAVGIAKVQSFYCKGTVRAIGLRSH